MISDATTLLDIAEADELRHRFVQRRQSASNRTPGRAPDTPTTRISGKAVKNAIVDLRRANLCSESGLHGHRLQGVVKAVLATSARNQYPSPSSRDLLSSGPEQSPKPRPINRDSGICAIGTGVNTCDHVYEEPLMPALRHSPRPGDQRKHNSLISSTPAATSNGLERAMQKVIGLTISPQPTQTDAGQSTTRRFRVTQTGTGEPLNKP